MNFMESESSITESLASSNLVERTVSELSASLKRVVEDNFGLVRVRGEVGRVTRPGSGHVYLDLKDDRAVLSAVIWKGNAGRLKTFPEQGLEVVVTGKLTTFPNQSRYQIIIETLEPAGAGALMALLEERKKKLEAEGLFAEERKQPLPFMPRIIGVVTSPTGAVIRDVLHRISDRFPLHVMVWPVRVQGETCAAEVSAAIAGFNAFDNAGPLKRPDLIIVARGGGSIEDLWGFNDEMVVRAAAASEIPLISAVGHETDWTLIDLAADRRAPTPTGAAEMAVPVKAELEAQSATFASRLQGAIRRIFDRRRTDLRSAARALGSPDDILAQPRQQVDRMTGRLETALSYVTRHKRSDLRGTVTRLNSGLLTRRMRLEADSLQNLVRRADRAFVGITIHYRSRFEYAVSQLNWRKLDRIIGSGRNQLENIWRLLASLSHESVLQRGFALIRNSAGTTITSAAMLRPGESFNMQFHDGQLAGTVDKETGSTAAQKGNTKKPATKQQGSLF
jgi:exodeoxyribonuclease VII large subunit